MKSTKFLSVSGLTVLFVTSLSFIGCAPAPLSQLHLDPNGGSGAVETTAFSTGVAVAIPVPTGITKTGSILAAWNTAADGSGTYYDLTEEVTLTADLTLYAMWSTDGLEYSLINSDTEYSVKKGSATATEIEVSGYWMGKKVTEVEHSAFKDYNALTDIKLPPTITLIQAHAFSGCANLALTSLPDGIETIRSSAFFNAKKITLTSLPSGLTQLDLAVFYGCSGVNLTSLPSGLEHIAGSALSGTKSSFTTLPGTVTTLVTQALGGTAMASMTIPASVTSIGSQLFNNNDVITEVTLEGDYSELTDTFKTDSANGKLATVNITNDTTPATLVGDVFPSTVTSIKVPSSAVDTYKTATGWTGYAGIISAYSP
ncbi:MAG: hypothetical protein B0D92_02455 [Spirochaeta sp. LUC14_002_19_P3]|nr:MAG: hypothetical protein B0D92_02455 [Spirochaeta sp. LUC14_002_19_P3]